MKHFRHHLFSSRFLLRKYFWYHLFSGVISRSDESTSVTIRLVGQSLFKWNNSGTICSFTASTHQMCFWYHSLRCKVLSTYSSSSIICLVEQSLFKWNNSSTIRYTLLSTHSTNKTHGCCARSLVLTSMTNSHDWNIYCASVLLLDYCVCGLKHNNAM